MEIILKMDPHYKKDDSDSLQLKDSFLSKACGYSFEDDLNYSFMSMDLQVKKSTSTNDSLTEEFMQKIIEEYKEHRIDSAYSLKNKYLDTLKSHNLEVPKPHMKLLQTIEQEMNDLLSYQNQLKAQGWLHKKDGKNYKIFTKQFPQTVAVLVQAQLQIPIQHFLFVCNQIQLMKNIMPFMAHSQEVKTIARNNKIGHIINDIPFLSLRQAFFQGIGYDRLQHNSTILLYSRSLHNRPDLQQKLEYTVNVNKKSIQLQYKFFLIQYQPVDRKKGKLKIGMNVDLKLSVPKFILDPIIQNFGKDFLKNVLNVTNNFKGSQWEKRSLQKTQFTQFIQQTINRHFDGQKIKKKYH